MCFWKGQVTWVCHISPHRASMEITSNERWSQQTHTALISVWALTSGQLLSRLKWWLQLTEILSDTNIQHSKTQDSFPPLFGILSLPIKYILFIMSIDLIMLESTTHHLVQYVSKQQCLKKKMELPYPLALQIVKQANKNFGYQRWFKCTEFHSTVVHCFSILQLPVHKKQ